MTAENKSVKPFAFPVTKGMVGHIRGDNVLDGVEVQVIDIGLGSFTVKLLQNRGAYKNGNTVVVGSGEMGP